MCRSLADDHFVPFENRQTHIVTIWVVLPHYLFTSNGLCFTLWPWPLRPTSILLWSSGALKIWAWPLRLVENCEEPQTTNYCGRNWEEFYSRPSSYHFLFESAPTVLLRIHSRYRDSFYFPIRHSLHTIPIFSFQYSRHSRWKAPLKAFFYNWVLICERVVRSLFVSQRND